MNDLEICKRIAEIEGFEFDVKTLFIGGPLGVWPKCGFKKVGMSTASGSYNPLIDDALCFQLMTKYKVSVFYEYGYAAIVDDDSGEYVGDANLHKSPNKAMLLAIIEAHYGSN